MRRNQTPLQKIDQKWNLERHKAWPQFMNSVKIEGIRGWRGELIDFRFPVVALAGVNGSGKSTVLKAAATAYRNPTKDPLSSTYSPDDFFPSTPWEEVTAAYLTFVLQRGDQTTETKLRKPTTRWRGMKDRHERPSFFLDISRIQPANTQIGYGSKQQKIIYDGTSERLQASTTKALNRILGRVYDQGEFNRKGTKQVGVLYRNGISYSNFHQGAGEDSCMDLLALMEKAPAHSLVLIDEVEASLHPMAQRRLVTALLETALEKRLQVIMTTHSPYILEELPELARIFIQPNGEGGRDLLYGVSWQYALSMMDDRHHPELEIFCEDEEAKYIIDRILLTVDAELAKRVAITPVGPSNVVSTLGQLHASGKLRRRGLAVVDGDVEASKHHLSLPGEAAPEREVLNSLNDDQWERVAVRISQPAGYVLEAKDDALQLRDHHQWCSHISERLGGRERPRRIWETAVDVWLDEVVGYDACESWAGQVSAALA